MVHIVLGPEFDLARRLQKMERTLSETRCNPVVHTAVTTEQAGFSLDVGSAAVGQQSVLVPDGYGSCRIFSGVSVAAINTTAATGEIYVASSINHIGGDETHAWTPANTLGSASAMTTRTLNNLTAGETVTVEALVRTGSGTWASNTENIASVSAIFLFER